jgi:hypothetical protein
VHAARTCPKKIGIHLPLKKLKQLGFRVIPTRPVETPNLTLKLKVFFFFNKIIQNLEVFKAVSNRFGSFLEVTISIVMGVTPDCYGTS